MAQPQWPSPSRQSLWNGATPLASVIRFDDRVRHFASYLRDAYLVETLRGLGARGTLSALSFVARYGEVVHGHVIGWGEQEALGPLVAQARDPRAGPQIRSRRSRDRRAEEDGPPGCRICSRSGNAAGAA